MSEFNVAAKSKDDQGFVDVDLAVFLVVYNDRFNMPICINYFMVFLSEANK